MSDVNRTSLTASLDDELATRQISADVAYLQHRFGEPSGPKMDMNDEQKFYRR
jgi:hypothetical protein